MKVGESGKPLEQLTKVQIIYKEVSDIIVIFDNKKLRTALDVVHSPKCITPANFVSQITGL